MKQFILVCSIALLTLLFPLKTKAGEFKTVSFSDVIHSTYKILRDDRVSVNIPLEAQYLQCGGFPLSEDIPNDTKWKLVYNIPALIENGQVVTPEMLYRTEGSDGNSAFEQCIITNMEQAFYGNGKNSVSPETLAALVMSAIGISVLLGVAMMSCIVCIIYICARKQPLSM